MFNGLSSHESPVAYSMWTSKLKDIDTHVGENLNIFLRVPSISKTG